MKRTPFYADGSCLTSTLYERDSLSRDPLPGAGETEAFLSRCLDADARDVHVQRRGNVCAHPLDMRRELRRLSYNGRVQIAYLKALGPEPFADLSEQEMCIRDRLYTPR